MILAAFALAVTGQSAEVRPLKVTPDMQRARDAYVMCVRKAAKRYSKLDETTEAVATAALNACPSEKEEFGDMFYVAILVDDPTRSQGALAGRQQRFLDEVDRRLKKELVVSIMDERSRRKN